MPPPLSYAQIAQNIKDKYNGEYTLITKGTVTNRTKIEVKHKCGNVLNTTHQSFVNDSKGRCQICYPPVSKGKQAALTINDVIERLGDEYTYIDGYKNTKVKMKVKHNPCGNIFTVLPKDLFAKKSGCRTCANNNARGKYLLTDSYLETILKESKFNDLGEYEWLEEYKIADNKIPLLIKHITCGLEYKVAPNSFQQGARCPQCSTVIPNESKNHKLIREILIELNIPFIDEFTDDRCKHIRHLRFDFMIQLKDKKLLIEYDGEQHFRNMPFTGINSLKIIQHRDKIKNEFINTFTDEFILERITYKDDIYTRINEIFTEHEVYTLFNIVL
jgi:hypothetical protein